MAIADNLTISTERTAAYEAWYQAYHDRIIAWSDSCSVGDTAEVVLMLPDLLTVVMHLAESPTVPAESQAAFAKLFKRITEDIELLPANERALVGLDKDSMKIATVLNEHWSAIPEADITASWAQSTPLSAQLHYLLHERKTNQRKKGC